jgi:hypothetical protein
MASSSPATRADVPARKGLVLSQMVQSAAFYFFRLRT